MTSTAIVRPMTVVLADPDPAWLEERRLMGIDKRDEVWDGVLHVPPTPGVAHQDFAFDLHTALRPIVKSLGLRIIQETTIYDPVKGLKNYRSPDLVVAEPGDFSKRGIEGHAELAIEILSPNDESYEKFDFYATRQIAEYWIVDPETRQIEVYVLRGNKYVAVLPHRDGTIAAPRLGLELQVLDGPRLRITWSGGSAEI